MPDPAPIYTGVGLSEANAIAMSQSGQFVVKVENAMLIIYEWSGHGMTVTWKRRCQLQAPDGYTFRTSKQSLCGLIWLQPLCWERVGFRSASSMLFAWCAARSYCATCLL
jgi:hypothetical protein